MKINKLTAQDMWHLGLPISYEKWREIYDSEWEAYKALETEERKSIRQALERGRGVAPELNDDGTMHLFRLCDSCGKARGPMWIVRPDVWRKVIPNAKQEDDICMACWQKLISDNANH